MSSDATTEMRTLLAEAQFVLAQLLWDPRCDRARARQLAELAALAHPELDKRAAIAAWLESRTPLLHTV